MKDRSDYRKYSTEDFAEELSMSLMYFMENMNKLDVDNLSFPEWYETFGAWLEVGTDVEEMVYK